MQSTSWKCGRKRRSTRQTIDRELEWAQSLGFNTLRVFLHDLGWKEDPEGFCDRIDKFLQIAEKHDIRVMLVLFDGVWDPDPQSGPQRRPRAGVHNSGWVQGPGRFILADEQRTDALKPYVVEIVRRFGRDNRVLAWDLFNEPDNPNKSSYGPLELPNKDEAAARLVNRTFAWAREASPSQPLTVGVWAGGPWDDAPALNHVHRAALAESDVISFHNYGDPNDLKTRIAELKDLDRPMLCTEFMARGNGSTFEAVLPVLKEEKIAAYCWGLVDGKSQTKYPWKSWQMPIAGEPKPWHHDIFHTDGRPYRQAEVEFIRRATAHAGDAVPISASGG